MDYILIIAGTISILAGVIGCFLPVIPGPPISYVGILLLHFTDVSHFSVEFLVFFAVAVVIVQILDYYLPILGTKKFGGGSRGAWGSAIGVVVGLFIIPPWGIIIFPFVGAVVGELTDGKEFNAAVKSGFGAFIGFVGGILFKLAVSLAIAFFFFKDVGYFLWQMIKSIV